MNKIKNLLLKAQNHNANQLQYIICKILKKKVK